MSRLRILPIAVYDAAASGAEHWWRISAESAEISSIQIVWHDATTAFDAPVLYSSNQDDPTVPAVGAAAPSLTEWSLESGVSIAAVAASAAGSKMVHLGNCGARYLLLKINPTAASVFSIYAHAKG